MEDFIHLSRIVRDAIGTGAWPTLLIFYGGSLAIGIVGAKIAFALSRTLGFAAMAVSMVYLYNLSAASGGIIVPMVYPPAWTAIGCLFYFQARYFD